MTDRVVIVVAAGSSLRFGSDKLMTEVAGRPIVVHTVEAVRGRADRCILVCRSDQMPTLEGMRLDVELVPGGPSRTASEMAGLSVIGGPAGLIAIHDGARPLVSQGLVETLFERAGEVGGAIPVLPPPMPLVRRSDLTLVEGAAFAQTPQVFEGERLFSAYMRAARVEYEGHDTAEIAQKFSDLSIEGVPGEPGNIKVTHPADIELVRAVLEPSRNGPR
jgi:2-C-methyl-D-erythritol 4-phosphate cytidylyltransferase